mmetsp:Transcript_24173/g.56185  ORF Transcript_24173/g.56185 Transcript_24173/m.56185 type:complete len:95 (+) Transcript_24173:66-350(+)
MAGRALSRGYDAFVKGMMQPGSKIFNRTSWAVTIVVVAKLTWDAEKENPVIFSEAPNLWGTPRASQVESDFQEKWNSRIAPKEMQVTWKEEKKG